MKTSPRFYVKKRCQWCGIHNDHYVDFEIYLLKEDKVFYRVTCEFCFTKALRSKNHLYNFTRYECTSKEWDNWIPKTIQILN